MKQFYKQLVLILAIFVTTAVSSSADEPMMTLRFKNAATVHTFWTSNSFINDTKQTTLYEGLTYFVSPLLHSLPLQQNKTWQGKLYDFLLEKVLSGRSFSVSYFRGESSENPFVITFENLGKIELAVIGKVIESLRTMPDQTVNKVKITPISISNQKLAVVINKTCLFIGISPKNVGNLSSSCLTQPLSLDAELRINIEKFVGGPYRAISKWYGIDNTLKVGFRYDTELYRFVPQDGELGLSKVNAANGILWSKQDLESIPADHELSVFANLPDIDKKSLADPEIVSRFLTSQLSKTSKNQTKVRFAILDTVRAENIYKSHTRSAVLMDNTTGLAKIFSGLYDNSTNVCGEKWTLLSEITDQVIEDLELVCTGKEPSLAKAGTEIVNFLTEKPTVISGVINLPKLLTNTYNLGWQLTNTNPMPDELLKTNQLLNQTPAIAWRGENAINKIKFSFKTGAL